MIKYGPSLPIALHPSPFSYPQRNDYRPYLKEPNFSAIHPSTIRASLCELNISNFLTKTTCSLHFSSVTATCSTRFLPIGFRNKGLLSVFCEV